MLAYFSVLTSAIFALEQQDIGVSKILYLYWGDCRGQYICGRGFGLQKISMHISIKPIWVTFENTSFIRIPAIQLLLELTFLHWLLNIKC